MIYVLVAILAIVVVVWLPRHMFQDVKHERTHLRNKFREKHGMPLLPIRVVEAEPKDKQPPPKALEDDDYAELSRDFEEGSRPEDYD